jgi:pimeloyl-ACP methyl ester carboxylesterase
MSDTYKEMPTKGHLGAIGAATLIGAAIGAGASVLHGTEYNYQDYKMPKDKRQITIAFSGGNGGDWQKYNPDKAALDRQFGKGNYALFGYNDVDIARAYLHSLPGDARLRIIGHSLGGPAAYALAEYAAEIGMPVSRLDTEDPVGRYFGKTMANGKPLTTDKWFNYYPEHRSLGTLRNPRGSDMAALLGGAFNRVEGATNVPVTDPEYATHRTIRWIMPDSRGNTRHVPRDFRQYAGMEDR